MAKTKKQNWQIRKNILDLEYRDLKESINNHVIIIATLSIAFFIAFLQDSFPQRLEFSAVMTFLGVFAILSMRIIIRREDAKHKLKEIENLKT